MKNLVVKTVGGCMRPLIRDKDIMFILPKNNYRRGDIVLYETNNQKFLHRIIKVLDTKKFIVCDDTGITMPTEISLDNILGFYPTIFSGFVGYLYHTFVKTIFCITRKIKFFLFS